MTSKSKWIPSIKEDFILWSEKHQTYLTRKRLTDKDYWRDSSIEYSVVREGTHGEISWGWEEGENKIILFRDMQLPSKLPQLKRICIEFAEFLNKKNF